MKRNIDMSRIKVIRGGRPRSAGERSKVTGKILKRVDADQRFGPKLVVAVPDDPELRHKMRRADALQMFEPLPIPARWTVYANAPEGDIAAAMPALWRIMRAASLLHELGIVHLAQRRTKAGTEYLVRRTRNLTGRS